MCSPSWIGSTPGSRPRRCHPSGIHQTPCHVHAVQLDDGVAHAAHGLYDGNFPLLLQSVTVYRIVHCAVTGRSKRAVKWALERMFHCCIYPASIES